MATCYNCGRNECECGSNPLDQPEHEGMALVVPFVVCQSQGGPYDDEAFVAGFQAGQIDQAMTAAQAVNADRMSWTVRTALVPQLELLAMNRGFPHMVAETIGGFHDMPDWSFVTFASRPLPVPD